MTQVGAVLFVTSKVDVQLVGSSIVSSTVTRNTTPNASLGMSATDSNSWWRAGPEGYSWDRMHSVTVR